MSENSPPYANEKGMSASSKPWRRKRISPRDASDYNDPNRLKRARKINGIAMRNWKPSYCLKCDVIGNESLRSQHRKKLRKLLIILMLQHNWIGASGVLSVLLKGTLREKSLTRNQYKYSATLELLKKIKGDNLNAYNVQQLYDLWMKKLGSTQDKFGVQLESVLFSLCQGNTSVAQVDAGTLTQDIGFEKNSIANFIVGLTYCQQWYSTIPKEFQLEDLNRSGTTPVQSNQSESYISFENSDGHDAVDTDGSNLPLEGHSSTSIGNEKDNLKVSTDRNKEASVVEPNNGRSRVGSQETGSSEESNIEKESFHPNQIDASIFYTRGLPPWLLPLQLPQSTENMEEVLYTHKSMLNNHYTDALKHLRAALRLDPPVFEALHPLIQMLLLGDQVMEAISELESVSHKLDTSIYIKLKASLVEYFDNGNDIKLCKHFEDILKKDPTCCHTLTKLIDMYNDGVYSVEKLVEMIGLHLEAVVGDDCKVWIEMASCFYKLSYSEEEEEEEVSTCGKEEDDGGDVGGRRRRRVPALFTDLKTKDTWRLRCRWWITRHFSHKRLALDTASDDMDLLTYKAVIASYLYGREFMYSVKATQHLMNEKRIDLLSILQRHCDNASSGFMKT